MQVNFLSDNLIMNLGIPLFFLVFLLVFVLLIVIFLPKRQQTYKDFKPKITVIIPAHNEEKHIAKCIKAIQDTNYKDLQIICIDDQSTDKTNRIIKRLQKKDSRIEVIIGKHEGKAAALNLAVKKAKHEFIVSIDADTFIQKDFITEIIKPFQDKTIGATNGMALVHKPRTIIERFQNVEYYYNNLIRRSFSEKFLNGIWFFGAAAAYRKDALKKVNYFSNDVLTEDMDMMLKLLKANYKVLSLRNVIYHTVVPHNIIELIKQRRRWFFGGLDCITRHRTLLKKNSFPIRFLFSNQAFWSLYSLLIIPLVIYQVNFWLPETGVFWYIFRWFSLAGPVMVLYKLPVWGLNFTNIFGVLAGIITTILLLIATKKKLNLSKLIAIFFYFPYTLILNLAFLAGLFYFPFKKRKSFVK